MLSLAAPRVLVIGAPDGLPRTMAELLPGAVVSAQDSAADAIAALEASPADGAELALVVLDPAVPGAGLAAVEQLHQLAPEAHVLLCSAAPVEHRELAGRFGDSDAIGVVALPCTAVELAQGAQALVTRWLRCREARARIMALEAMMTARTGQLELINRRLNEQLQWRSRVESEMRVSQRLEAVGQLAAGIAHEVNNPLQYISDHLEFVHDATADLLALVGRLDGCLTGGGALDAAAREAFAALDVPYMTRELPGAIVAIQDGIQRITSIVRAMKELSHPGTRDARVADLNRAIESALEISATSYRAIADLEKRLAPLPPVTCFVAELGQVFLNLIINAAQAMEGKRRGTLSVSSAVDEDGQHVVITIADTGGGIPAEIQQRIFDPFFTTKEVGRGTGQGLAIARAIVVERHGGSLSFDSIPGQGTTFIIRIPIHGPRQAIAAA